MRGVAVLHPLTLEGKPHLLLSYHKTRTGGEGHFPSPGTHGHVWASTADGGVDVAAAAMDIGRRLLRGEVGTPLDELLPPVHANTKLMGSKSIRVGELRTFADRASAARWGLRPPVCLGDEADAIDAIGIDSAAEGEPASEGVGTQTAALEGEPSGEPRQMTTRSLTASCARPAAT